MSGRRGMAVMLCFTVLRVTMRLVHAFMEPLS